MNNNFIVIDPLYIMDIKEYIMENGFLRIEKIKEMVFPFPCTEYPFSIIESDKYFKIENIKKVIDINLIINKDLVFATDSGIIIIIRQDLFLEFVYEFEYDHFVGNLINIINVEYWVYFGKKYNSKFILSNSNLNLEFVGSGLYYIDNY